MKIGPVVLLILDGWGIAPKNRGNAIELAKKPNFDFYWHNYPHTELKAHGQFVGVPKNQVGNSEAGHVNIGAGRVITDDAVEISEDIKLGRFKKNLAINQTIDFVIENKSRLHLMGLISDGQSPHVVLEHLYFMVDLAFARKIKKIYLHLFTDGRDSPQREAIKILDNVMKKIGNKAELVSLIGRFYAMDRGKNWARTKLAYDCITDGGANFFENYQSAMLNAYNQDQTDEYLEPCFIGSSKRHVAETRIKEQDAVIFFNARSDRARQLAKCFVQIDFNKKNKQAFRRKKVYKNIKFCALTDFGPDLDNILTAYPSPELDATLPYILEDKKQVYIAETEKYAHITYFINGGYDEPVDGEKRIKIDSPIVASYADKPEMSVYKITEQLEIMLEKNMYDFYAVNFANPDMVGHTGDLSAVVLAIEHVDKCLGKLAKLVKKKNGTLIVTADHGNAEKMIDLKSGEVWASHTTNTVPFILINEKMKNVKLRKGQLSDIAPTIYDVFQMKKLPQKLNKSLIK